jgi:hypothetical protein
MVTVMTILMRDDLDMDDPELDAMRAVAAALEPLRSDEKGVARVLRWAREKYLGEAAGDSAGAKRKATAGTPDEFEDVASLYVAASPKTDAERALVVGYWFQVHQGMKDFDSQRVNAELKNMGHGVGNITDAFTTLIDRKPQYVIQTRKSGTSRQARKLYRVTNEGINRVRDLLGGSRDDLQ